MLFSGHAISVPESVRMFSGPNHQQSTEADGGGRSITKNQMGKRKTKMKNDENA